MKKIFLIFAFVFIPVSQGLSASATGFDNTPRPLPGDLALPSIEEDYTPMQSRTVGDFITTMDANNVDSAEVAEVELSNINNDESNESTTEAESDGNSDDSDIIELLPNGVVSLKNVSNIVDKISEKSDSEKSDSADSKSGKSDLAGRLLGGLSTAATGIGGMQLAQGISEQNADLAAAADMEAYLSTFRCGLSGGMHNITGGTMNVDTPGYNSNFIALMTEYAALADKTKTMKEELGIAPGIESEVIIDKSSIYGGGAIGGASDSRYDTAAERLESGDAMRRIQTGAIVAGAGIVGGVASNVMMNRNASDEK